jgi:hypothetical protein
MVDDSDHEGTYVDDIRSEGGSSSLHISDIISIFCEGLPRSIRVRKNSVAQIDFTASSEGLQEYREVLQVCVTKSNMFIKMAGYTFEESGGGTCVLQRLFYCRFRPGRRGNSSVYCLQ